MARGPARGRPPSGFSVLRVPDFRLFVLACLGSFANQWLIRIGQDWMVLELTEGSGVALALTTVAQFLPIMLFAAWGGMLADRVSKLAVLVACEALTAACAAAMLMLTLTEAGQAWHIWLIALVGGCAAALATPARQTMPGELVPAGLIVSGVSLVSSSFSVARIAGPAIAGGIISALGMTALWASCIAVPVVVVAIQLVILGRTRRARHERRDAPQAPGLGLGLRHVWGRRDLRLAIIVLTVVCVLGWNSHVTIALMATQEFGRDAAGFAFLASAFAVGTLTGTLIAAGWARSPTLGALAGLGLGFSALQAVSGLVPGFEAFAGILIPLGAASVLLATMSNVLFQLSCEAGIRGRVMAVYLMVTSGAVALGAPLVGWLADELGARGAYVVTGALILATVLAAVILVRAMPALAE